MTNCEHSLAEMETTCADGYCPICLVKELADVRLELSTPSTMGMDKEPLYKWAALIVCEGHQLKTNIQSLLDEYAEIHNVELLLSELRQLIRL